MNIEQHNGLVILKFDDTQNGNFGVNAPVKVLIQGGGTATIYSNKAGTALQNPFVAGTNGEFSFFAAPGYYTLVVNEGNAGEYTEDIQVGNTTENVTILENADLSNTGKIDIPLETLDLNDITENCRKHLDPASPNLPLAERCIVDTFSVEGGRKAQLVFSFDSNRTFFRRKSGVYGPWNELFHSATRSADSAESVLNQAEAGGIGEDAPPEISNLDDANITGFFSATNSTLNIPLVGDFSILQAKRAGAELSQIAIKNQTSEMFFRTKFGTWFGWRYVLDSENIGKVTFNQAPTNDNCSLGNNGTPEISIQRPGTGYAGHIKFNNGNGQVGIIGTSGTSTSYSTSSDPRLKTFKDNPTDRDIDSKFNALFSCFAAFKWRSEKKGKVIWGFDAHKAIDLDLDIATEGDGPRNKKIGDVYNVIPKVTKLEKQFVYDDDGRFVLDKKGNEVTREVERVIKPERKELVTPAGVDYSKAVPILLAKMEQQERKITELTDELKAVKRKANRKINLDGPSKTDNELQGIINRQEQVINDFQARLKALENSQK